jgi:hypothetical protein
MGLSMIPPLLKAVCHPFYPDCSAQYAPTQEQSQWTDAFDGKVLVV